MGQIDVTKEWRRLQESYAGMSEDELEVIANDGDELTEIARQALQAEISRRGLTIEVEQPAPASSAIPSPNEVPSGPTPDDQDLIELFQVADLNQARNVQERLGAAGVPSYLGPIAVKIKYFDELRARRELSRTSSEPAPAGEDEDIPDYSPRCPKCHSTEIVFQGLDSARQSGVDSKYNWSCDACGYQWKDDGVESKS